MTRQRVARTATVTLAVVAVTGTSVSAASPSAADTIAGIQGTSWVSPHAGDAVTGVTGVVTAIKRFGSARGFWFQDLEGDDDPRTSEGLFVFTGSTTPDLAPGDAVSVDGTVKEFYPTNPADSPYLSTTELIDPEWTVESEGNLIPDAELLKPDSVPDVLTAKPDGTIEPSDLEPDSYALDFWESREGMRMAVESPRLVGPSTPYNELYATTKPDQYPSPRGGTVYTGYDNDNTGVLKIESLIPFSERPFPGADTGDTLCGTTEGVIEYDRFGGYTLQATELGRVVDGGLEPETTREQRPNELSVASYNVENLSGVDDRARFDALARGIVENLRSPDIVALAEIQDNNGPESTNDGVVAANKTLQRFTDAIADAGGPRYEWRQIDPLDGEDGGQPGGNIRVGFLFDPDRVSFVDREGGDATTAVEVTSDNGAPELSISPGRIAPNDDAFAGSRKPLAGQFSFRGRRVFVVATHFSSKFGDQPVHGRFQPPERASEQERIPQAELVREFADDVLAVDEHANVVVAGDINDFQFSPAIGTLTEGGTLRTLIDELPTNDQYTYIYEGRSQVLDHILVSPALAKADIDAVHINAEFEDQSSDHDPLITRLRPAGGSSAAHRP